jgi:hypothetical protein
MTRKKDDEIDFKIYETEIMTVRKKTNIADNFRKGAGDSMAIGGLTTAGAVIGSMIFPGIGTAIGAGIGVLVGAGSTFVKHIDE